MGTTVRKTYAAGVAVPLSEKAHAALKELGKSDRSHNYVSLVSRVAIQPSRRKCIDVWSIYALAAARK